MRHTRLLEIRRLQITVKTLVYKGVDFYVQNALKLTYEHPLIPKLFRGLYPGPPLKRRGWREWITSWLLGMDASERNRMTRTSCYEAGG